jgi:hypothetical protein
VSDIKPPLQLDLLYNSRNLLGYLYE